LVSEDGNRRVTHIITDNKSSDYLQNPPNRDFSGWSNDHSDQSRHTNITNAQPTVHENSRGLSQGN